MIQKIKNKLLILASMLTLAVPVAVPVAVHAQDIRGGLCQGAELQFNSATGACERITTNESSFNSALAKIINILSVIIGVIAVIMIIIGGFRYITSGGAAEKVTGAKNTILYAIIGLIIVALAQVIVRFVLKTTTDSVS